MISRSPVQAVLAAAASRLAGGGSAFPQAPPQPPGSTTVSGVTVTMHRPPSVSEVTVTSQACPSPDPERYAAADPPRVVDTYPAQGAVVAPGLLAVRVTFSAPMACYWAVESVGLDDKPPCSPSGAWDLPGRTTFRMTCRLAPGIDYRIRLGAVEGHDFYGMSGRSAEPYVLRLSTSRDTPVQSLAQSEADDPGPAVAPRAPVTGQVVCTDPQTNPGSPPCVRQSVAETTPRPATPGSAAP